MKKYIKNTGRRSRRKKINQPIQQKEQVQQSNDEHIDQDYPGFPHPPAKEQFINPETDEERMIAGVDPPGDEDVFEE